MDNFNNTYKLFVYSNQSLERDLERLQRKHQIELVPKDIDNIDEDYFPQFSESLRSEAKLMSRHYEVFYCLERSIRKIIEDTLKASHGENWWNICIADDIKSNVRKNLQRERESGFTPRSEKDIDYTTFGELINIVERNWSDFDPIFSNQKAFNKIMSNLNMLRGPIAHCATLALDEIERLNLTLKDWFRLME